MFGCRLRSWLPLSEGVGFSTGINPNHGKMNVLFKDGKIGTNDGIAILDYVQSGSCDRNVRQWLTAAEVSSSTLEEALQADSLYQCQSEL